MVCIKQNIVKVSPAKYSRKSLQIRPDQGQLTHDRTTLLPKGKKRSLVRSSSHATAKQGTIHVRALCSAKIRRINCRHPLAACEGISDQSNKTVGTKDEPLKQKNRWAAGLCCPEVGCLEFSPRLGSEFHHKTRSRGGGPSEVGYTQSTWVFGCRRGGGGGDGGKHRKGREELGRLFLMKTSHVFCFNLSHASNSW